MRGNGHVIDYLSDGLFRGNGYLVNFLTKFRITLIVINCSDARSQGRVRLPWEDLGDRIWQLEDLFSDSIYEREGKEMTEPGLFVDLDPWGFHYLKF